MYWNYIPDDRVIELLRSNQRVRHVVYISCQADGLAMNNFVSLCHRPTRKMNSDPFVLRKAIPVDMFPHTDHCELVLSFRRWPLHKMLDNCWSNTGKEKFLNCIFCISHWIFILNGFVWSFWRKWIIFEKFLLTFLWLGGVYAAACLSCWPWSLQPCFLDPSENDEKTGCKCCALQHSLQTV